MVARVLLTVLPLLVLAAVLAPSVAAQGADTIYDETGVLSDTEEQRVQEAFEQAVYDTMVPDFQSENFAGGLVAGAEEIQGEPVAPQSDVNAGGSPTGTI